MNGKIIKAYSLEERPISVSLKHLNAVLNPDFGLVSEIHRERQHYDEPKFWHFSARVNDRFIEQSEISFTTVGSGCSFFSKQEALFKCLAEVVERFSNTYFPNGVAIKLSTISDVQHDIVPLESFSRYSKKQLNSRLYSRFVFKPDSKLRWTMCESLDSNKQYLIPCNFIYLSYPHAKEEPLIYPPISTGVAAGGTLATAVLRGLYECIERDAYMLAYLKKIQYPKVRLERIKNKKVQFFLETANKYDLEISCLDFTTNMGIPVICALVLDRSGVGKAVSVGLKCNTNAHEAITGAITEAFHTRGWIRRMHEMDDSAYQDEIKRAKDPGMIQRGLFWYNVEKIKKLDFWSENGRYIEINENVNRKTVKEELEYVMSKLHEHHMDAYWKDITVGELSPLGLKVVKTIVPQLQPLTFDDDRQPQGGPRLNDVPRFSGYNYEESKINKYPHPFL